MKKREKQVKEKRQNRHERSGWGSHPCALPLLSNKRIDPVTTTFLNNILNDYLKQLLFRIISRLFPRIILKELFCEYVTKVWGHFQICNWTKNPTPWLIPLQNLSRIGRDEIKSKGMKMQKICNSTDQIDPDVECTLKKYVQRIFL